ncbi:chromosome partitioning protein [Lentzea sp. NPDC042327]|uniref:chromosome partitioning protein n=1 Tax=Lentzea sp. NPDC042327 TaxID=3154801 RepID=UPI0034030B0B
MMVITCSLKGSPGASTLAVALGTRWPEPVRPIVVEVDPAGGDVAARFQLPGSPGLVSLAAATRGNSDADLLAQHAHALASGLRIVPAPSDPAQSRAAFGALASSQFRPFRTPGVTLIVDAGRVDPDPTMLGLLRSADALVVVARPHDDSLAHIAARGVQIQTWSRHAGLAIVGKGYPAAQITEAFGLPVLTSIPDDAKGAQGLWDQRGSDSALSRHAAGLADHLLRTASQQMPLQRSPR